MTRTRAYAAPAAAPTVVPLGRVLVLGPDDLLVRGLATLLADALPVTVTASTDSRSLQDEDPDVVVVDATSRGGAEAMLRAATAAGRRVVLLGPSTGGAARSGSVSTPSDLFLGVARALGVAGSAAAPGDDGALDVLSTRERQVLDRTACGLSEAEVALELAISPHTVRTHLRNASGKLGVRPQEAVAAARRSAPPQERVRQPYAAPVLAGSGSLPLVLAVSSPVRAAALALVLRGAPRVELVAVAADGDELAAVLRTHAVRLALVDAQADDAGALLRLLADEDGCRAIAVGAADPDVVRRVLDAGAVGYLPLGSDPATVGDVLHAVALGEAVVPPALLAKALTARREERLAEDRAVRRLMRLTRGEREVLPAVVQGWSDDRTAETLVVSPHTVRSHVQSALRKLEVPTRVELVALVRQHDLLRLLEDPRP